MEISFRFLTFLLMVISDFQECLSQTVQCDLTAISTCGMMLSGLADQSGDKSKPCKAAADIMTCLSPYEEPCSANTKSSGYAMYSQLMASVSGFKSLCKCLPLIKCTQMLAGPTGTTPSDGNDMSSMCSNFENTKMCIEPHKEKCKDDANMRSIMQSLNSMEQFCKKGCDLNKLQMCLKDMEEVGNLKGLYTNVDKICTKVQSYQQCSEPVIQKCMENQEQGFGMAKKQDEMVRQITDLLCVQERQALKQMGTCFNQSNVAIEMEKCGKLTTPKTNEDGEYEEEKSDAVQCERMAKFEDCLDMSLKDTCGADAARVATRVGQSMMRILYDAKDLDCPKDASSKLESGLLVLLLALIAAAFF